MLFASVPVTRWRGIVVMGLCVDVAAGFGLDLWDVLTSGVELLGEDLHVDPVV